MENNKTVKKDKGLRAIPHNIEAEQSVLGCCLLDEDAVMEVMEKIKVDDFYTSSHQTIFETMLDIYHANKPIDHVTLMDELERKGLLESIGGMDYIVTLTNIVPSAVNSKYYVDIVKRDSLMRKLIKASQDVIEKAYDNCDEDVLSYAEKVVFDIAEKEEVSALTKISNSLDDVLRKFEEIDKNGGAIRGIPTGFKDLDAMTNGLQKSDLILLAARPGFGKSSLAMNIAANAALNGNHHCAVFSLEMPKEQIVQRMLCSISSVSMQSALSGKLTQNDWKALWEGNKKLLEANIFIDDSSLNTPTEILNKCRRLKREKGLDLIVIDYLQLMNSGKRGFDAGNRQLEIGDLTRSLKIAARELQVPIILLSQLSRDVEKRANDHRPVVSDLRDSGSIEQDADIVLFIYNASRYSDAEITDGPNVCELIIAKHRNGPLGTVKVKWIPEITTFVDLDSNANKKSLEDMIPPEYKANTTNNQPNSDDIDF